MSRGEVDGRARDEAIAEGGGVAPFVDVFSAIGATFDLRMEPTLVMPTGRWLKRSERWWQLGVWARWSAGRLKV